MLSLLAWNVILGNLEILFRTSDTGRQSGFRGIVVCLDSTGAVPSGGTGRRRRRRDLEDFVRNSADQWLL